MAMADGRRGADCPASLAIVQEWLPCVALSSEPSIEECAG
jgi:hypothetical protein